MNLILTTQARCEDNGRHRLQWNIDSGAVFDRVHAWSDHWRLRCATTEAEKGKACKAVTNVVPPASPGNARFEEEKERKHVGTRGAKCARDAQHAVTASCSQECGSLEFRWSASDAGVLDVAQSSQLMPVSSDLHRAFLADPERRSTSLLHVAAASSSAKWFRSLSMPMTHVCCHYEHISTEEVPNCHGTRCTHKIVAGQDPCSCRATLACWGQQGNHGHLIGRQESQELCVIALEKSTICDMVFQFAMCRCSV